MYLVAACCIRLSPDTPRSARQLADKLDDTMWGEYFRFTKHQFFELLLPALHLPDKLRGARYAAAALTNVES